MISARSDLLPLAGTEAFVQAVVLAGPTKAGASFALAPINKREGIVPLGLTVGGNTLTRAMCQSDALVSTADGNTALFVPLLANITDIGSYTWVFGQEELNFRVERRGVGAFMITFDVAGGAIVEDPFGLLNPTDGSINAFQMLNIGLIGVNHWRVG